MTLLSNLVIIFGYISVSVFILGIAYRIWGWVRLPIGFSWALFPRPTRWTVTSLIWKAFAWPTLLKADKALWIGAALFHLGLVVVFVGHLGLLADIPSLMGRVGIQKETLYTIGVVAGIIIGIVLLFYVLRRVIILRVSEISYFADHFWLWCLFIVIGVGIYARLFHEVDSDAVRQFAISVFVFKPILPPQNLWFLLHSFLAELFIMYSIMGKPIHSVGQLFTQYIVVTER